MFSNFNIRKRTVSQTNKLVIAMGYVALVGIIGNTKLVQCHLVRLLDSFEGYVWLEEIYGNPTFSELHLRLNKTW